MIGPQRPAAYRQHNRKNRSDPAYEAQVVMMICSHRFRLFFLGAQGVHLGLDRLRAE
jgi:hypothetical protein